MPLWNIYCPAGTYAAEDKHAFAERVTELYAEFGLPRFFVSVVFEELPRDSYFIVASRPTISSASGSTKSPAGSLTMPGAGG